MANINLSGSISATGIAILGNVTVTISGNIDHTLSVAEYTNQFLHVVSDGASTGVRKVIAPLVQGQTFIVQNATSEGFDIQLIASTGTGVNVPHNTYVIVTCDGINYISNTAINIQGNAVQAGILGSSQDGYVLTWNNSLNKFEVLPTGTGSAVLNGDVTGPNSSTVVVNIHGASVPMSGALVTGNVLQVSGLSSLTYGPLNLGGGSNFVIGILPAVNQANQALAGDVTGFTDASTVININGTSVPATPLANQVLIATSGTSAVWEQISDAQVSVSAALAVSKLASGTSAQILQNNGTPTPTWTTVSGDVGITNAGVTTVTAIQKNPVQATILGASQDGYVAQWVNSATQIQFLPITLAVVDIFGDVTGTTAASTVAKLQNVAVATTTPVQSAVPVFDTVATQYDIRKLTLDDLGPAFTITSFTGGSTVEVGATVTNPTFNATYSSPASSAQITNTDGVDSPLVLITPFTSGTVVGSFTHNTITSVTFTLTASAATTKTANQSISYLARSFTGVGGTGATSATASGTNATLIGTSGTLTGSSSFGGLFGSIVGQSFGLLTPSGQKIYLLTPHTGSPHTFKDQNGFSFVFNAPTTFSFTNINGAVLSYDLYESTFVLSTNFTITVVS